MIGHIRSGRVAARRLAYDVARVVYSRRLWPRLRNKQLAPQSPHLFLKGINAGLNSSCRRAAVCAQVLSAYAEH